MIASALASVFPLTSHDASLRRSATARQQALISYLASLHDLGRLAGGNLNRLPAAAQQKGGSDGGEAGCAGLGNGRGSAEDIDFAISGKSKGDVSE